MTNKNNKSEIIKRLSELSFIQLEIIKEKKELTKNLQLLEVE